MSSAGQRTNALRCRRTVGAKDTRLKGGEAFGSVPAGYEGANIGEGAEPEEESVGT